MTATEPEEPKPCPFCGGEAETESPPECSPRTSWWVICENDRCAATPEVSGPTRAEAVVRWNRRSEK